MGTDAALLHCPFCGGTDIGAEQAEMHDDWFMRCQDCYATGPNEMTGRSADDIKAAEAAWNRRAVLVSAAEEDHRS